MLDKELMVKVKSNNTIAVLMYGLKFKPNEVTRILGNNKKARADQPMHTTKAKITFFSSEVVNLSMFLMLRDKSKDPSLESITKHVAEINGEQAKVMEYIILKYVIVSGLVFLEKTIISRDP